VGDLLVFLHIPKAAGRTFYRVLDRQVPAGTVFQLDGTHWQASIERLRAMPEEERRRLRVVQGHMGFGVHELFSQTARYITFVRDPVSRIVSHYHYALRSKNHYLHDEVVGRGLRLRDYATGGLTAELENGQTKLLAGPDDDLAEGTPEDLERAKRHVREHFVLAGLTERFDESLLLLKRDLGWANVAYERENVAPSAPRPPDPETVEAVRERNLLDLELHRFCADLLDERLAAAAGPAFDRELGVLRARNAALATALRPVRLLRGRVRGPVRRA
jgi:hypothetical protein